MALRLVHQPEVGHHCRLQCTVAAAARCDQRLLVIAAGVGHAAGVNAHDAQVREDATLQVGLVQAPGQRERGKELVARKIGMSGEKLCRGARVVSLGFERGVLGAGCNGKSALQGFERSRAVAKVSLEQCVRDTHGAGPLSVAPILSHLPMRDQRQRATV